MGYVGLRYKNRIYSKKGRETKYRIFFLRGMSLPRHEIFFLFLMGPLPGFVIAVFVRGVVGVFSFCLANLQNAVVFLSIDGM